MGDSMTAVAEPARTGRPRLWLPVLGMVLLAALVLWRTGLWQWREGLSDLREEAHGQLALRVAHLRGELERFEVLPRLLANDVSVVRFLAGPAERDPEGMSRHLAEANRLSGAADTYLMDTRGVTLAASNWDTPTSFVGENFNYRPYFQAALSGALGHYFALGTTSLRRGFYFSAPVTDAGQILGVLVVKVDVPAIEKEWAPMEGDLLVTDTDGIIFMSSRKEWLYHTLRPLSVDALERIRASRRYPGIDHEVLPINRRLVGYEGGGMLASDTVSAMSLFTPGDRFLGIEELMVDAGWRVHLLRPVRPVEERVLKALAAVAAAMLIAALLLLFLRQRRKRKHEQRCFEISARRALEQSESRVRTIIENTHAGLITLDEEDVIESINTTARSMFGLEEGRDWIGRPVQALLDWPAGRALPDSEAAPLEAEGVRGDGSRFPVEMAVREIALFQGRGRLVTLHDITARKRTENELREARDHLETRVHERTADLTATNIRLQAEVEERVRAEVALREAQDQLIQAAKLASLGEMSASISHELNQPLAAIRTYADNARQLLDHEREDEARANLVQIARLTERMARISGQLKTFARKTSGRLELVDPREVVQAAVDLATPQARKHRVTIGVSPLPEPSPAVVADRVQLEQVLINLLTNAIQAAEGTGPATVQVSLSVRGGEVVVAVEDTGEGIQDDKLPMVFEPFYTTKRSGLGLGLSISQGLMEAMGGRLAVANRAEGGAVFRAILPAFSDAAGEADAAEPARM